MHWGSSWGGPLSELQSIISHCLGRINDLPNSLTIYYRILTALVVLISKSSYSWNLHCVFICPYWVFQCANLKEVDAACFNIGFPSLRNTEAQMSQIDKPIPSVLPHFWRSSWSCSFTLQHAGNFWYSLLSKEIHSVRTTKFRPVCPSLWSISLVVSSPLHKMIAAHPTNSYLPDLFHGLYEVTFHRPSPSSALNSVLLVPLFDAIAIYIYGPFSVVFPICCAW